MSLINSRARQRGRFVVLSSGCMLGFLTLFLVGNLLMAARPQRLVWCVPRSQDWWKRIVLRTYDDDQWLDDFRMTRETFFWLCARLHPYVERMQKKCRNPISMEHRVVIALYHLASSANYETVANLFGVSREAVCDIVKDITEAIVDHLLPDISKIPEGQRLENVVNGFEERWGFPQCIGAIDGTHIPVTPPALHRNDYRNRKGWCSVNAQCIVDHQFLFIDVYAGWPGRSHDARVFKNSEVCVRAEQGNPLFPRIHRSITNTEIPLVLL